MKLSTVRFGKWKLSVREQILLMIAFVVIYLGGGYYFLLLPTQVSINEKKTTLADVSSRAAEIEPWVTMTERLPDILYLEDTKLSSVKEEIPSSVNMESILNLLNGTPDGTSTGIIQKTGVALKSVKPDNKIKDDAVEVKIQVSGTMEQMQGFLSELKKAKRFNTVKVLSYKGDGDGNQYTSDLAVNFYLKK